MYCIKVGNIKVHQSIDIEHAVFIINPVPDILELAINNIHDFLWPGVKTSCHTFYIVGNAS